MGKIFWNGGTLLSPVPPVLVSCGTIEKPNIITIAWTGIANTKPPMTYISVRPERYSYNIIKSPGEYVINLTTSALVKTADFCGVKSGAKTDKFKSCGLHPSAAEKINAPIIDESPLCLECVVKQIIPLGSHDMFIADVVNVQADDRYLDPQTGAFDMQKADLLAYSHGKYYGLGEFVGKFGWSVKKKK